MGWSREQLEGHPLTLTFTFDGMRNFTLVALHVFASPEDEFGVSTRRRRVWVGREVRGKVREGRKGRGWKGSKEYWEETR